MSNYNKITALYSRLSVGDEDRDGGESNSILPRATIGGFAADRGRYTSPATACAVYPFVYLRKANTLRCKLFTFHKSCNRSNGGDTHSDLSL